ncbi:MAG: hypothetical protein AB9919_11460 [Geobacteraceae bacterium]
MSVVSVTFALGVTIVLHSKNQLLPVDLPRGALFPLVAGHPGSSLRYLARARCLHRHQHYDLFAGQLPPAPGQDLIVKPVVIPHYHPPP